MRRTWITALALGVSLTVLAGGALAQDKRPYKIGSVFSLTGPGALLGARMKTTVEMMVGAVNKKGGINGHPVELVIYDAASDVTKAVAATNRLITQDKVDIITGAGNMSGLSLAMKPIAMRYAVPMISNAGASGIVEPIDKSAWVFKSHLTDREVILCWTVAPSGVVFMKNARQLGMKQILMHGFGYVVPKYMEMAGDAAEGAVLVSLRFPVGTQLADSDPTKKVILNYIAEHKAKYGSEPDVYGAEAYDGMLMALKALEAANGFDKEKIRSALERLEFIGTNGLYKFSPEKHYGLTKDDAVVMERRNGNWKLLMGADTK